MATNFLMSPGVLVKEQDQSSFVVTTAATQVAMVGFAKKGPVDRPVLTISAQDFIDKFGLPPEDNPYMALAALKYFEEGNSLLVTRVGYTTSDVRDLSTYAPSIEDPTHTGWTGRLQASKLEVDRAAQSAAVPAITGTRDFGNGLQYATTVDFTLNYYNQNLEISQSANVAGSIGGPGVTTAADVASALNTLLSSSEQDYFLFSTSGDFLVITQPDEDEFKDSQVTLVVTGSGGDTTITQLGFLEGNRSAMGVGDGAGAGIDPSGLTIYADTPGTWGDDISVRFYTEFVSELDTTFGTFITKPVHKLQVFYQGRLVENYQNVVYDDDTDENYIETLLGTGDYEEETGSDYIYIEWGTTANPDSPTEVPRIAPEDIPDDEDSYLQLADGKNGIPVVDATAGFNSSEVDALNNTVFTSYSRGVNTLSNSETYEFDVICAPGQSAPVVINELISLVNSRRDTIALIDPPFGLNHEDVAEWHNGQGSGNSSAFNTSYAALYWPWLHDYDPYNQQYLWLPPSGYVARVYTFTDNISDPWQAPAGMTRGRITALDVEQSASRSERDLLYGESNAVNPIVNFVGEGITIWGQKTLLRQNKATNRVNVRRLLIFAERLIARMARDFVFEPTDETSWANFTRRANAILEPIRIRRGLLTYQVVMDETTNPPEVQDQNKMVGYIFLQPTKTAEFIEVTFTVTSTGETFVAE